MIITCEQCNKKFEIESNLIPQEGRLLKCGSCEHVWFYKTQTIDESKKILTKPQPQKIESKKKKTFVKSRNKELKEIDPKVTEKTIKKTNKISLLNIILVFIITFIALLLLLETFKDPISEFVPNIKFLLNSLYEIINDIILFFKDLF